MRMWDEQVARMERYYRRCQMIKGYSSLATLEHDNDTIYSFLMHCHHLKDWFRRDLCYRHQRKHGGGCANGNCAECYVWNIPALELCQEICNAIKHLNSSEKAAVAGRGGSFVDGSVWFFVRCPDGTQRNAFEVIDEARSAWQAFVIHEAESAAGYDACYGPDGLMSPRRIVFPGM